jgi:enoyl-CoA hydratase/carnithine racemase
MAIISNLVFNHSLLVKTNKILLKRNAAYSYNMSTMKYIQLEPQGDIAILRINRPEALNAMNVDVISELSKMIDILAADDSIKAVVITGAGERSFCAGADISYMVNIDPMQAERYATSAQDVINRIDRLENQSLLQ